MNIYLYLLIIYLSYGLYIASTKDTLKQRKRYIIVCSFLLLLVNSLRSLEIGSDTLNYYGIYERTVTMSWPEIWDTFIGTYFYGTTQEDIGYVIFQKLISYITVDFHIFTFIAQLLFFVPLSILLYKYTCNIKQLVLAYAIYIFLLNSIPITNCRQTYAFGLCIIMFICYVERKFKYIPFLMVASATIHLSSLLFILPFILYPLSNKLVKVAHYAALSLAPIFFLFPNGIISYMGSMLGKDQYAGYGSQAIVGGANNFVLLLELTSIFCLFSYSVKEYKDNRFCKLLYVMVPLFTIFGPLINSNGTMIRISMYFHLFLVLLIPFGIELFFKKNQNVAYVIVMMLLAFLGLKDGGLEYYFFWEIDPITTW